MTAFLLSSAYKRQRDFVKVGNDSGFPARSRRHVHGEGQNFIGYCPLPLLELLIDPGNLLVCEKKIAHFPV